MSRTLLNPSRLRRPLCLVFYPPPPSARHASTTQPRTQNRLPAAYYRGGTSRAVIFRQQDLPERREKWAHIFRGVIGSPDANGRQLDGLGGGISSLSKVCVVGRSTRPDADVDYTFAAIGVKDSDVDYSSNCGNMTSAVGPFAVDSGLVDIEQREATGTAAETAMIRIHNTNTGKLIHARFPIVGTEAAANGDFAIDGVSGTGAKVELAFIDPSGSKTGKLLPTGNTTDVFDGVEASCVDAGNPCVFIENLDGIKGTILPDEIDAHPSLLSRLESIRRQASAAMGLSRDEASVPGSIPKIAMVSKPKAHTLLSGKHVDEGTTDLVVRALSVDQPHRAIPITVALAIAAAANIKGSTVQRQVLSRRLDPDGITLGHPTGKIMVGAKFDEHGHLAHATIFSTSRRIMDGLVYWK